LLDWFSLGPAFYLVPLPPQNHLAYIGDLPNHQPDFGERKNEPLKLA
jgi:hypothetical protein